MAKRSRRAVEASSAPTRKEIYRNRRDQGRLRQLTIIFGVLGAAIVAVLLWGVLQQYWLKPRVPVATVNGATITTAAYQDRVRYEKFRLEQRFGSLASGALAGQITQYIQSQLPTQVFETMITDQLLRQEATKQNVVVTDDDVTKSVEEEFDYYPNGTPTPTVGAPTDTPQPSPTLPPNTPAPTVGPTPTPYFVTSDKFKQDYSKFLSDLKTQTGLSESYYRDVKRSQVIYDRFNKQVIAQATIPATQLEVHARQILVDNEDDAKKVVDRLQAGEDFAAVAKDVSKDTQTKDKGGDLGWFPQGQKDPVVEKAAFSQPANAVGDPVKASDGWHVIQVLDAPQQRPLTSDEHKQKENEAFDKWLSDLQSKAAIERNFRADAIPQLTSNSPGAPPSVPQVPKSVPQAPQPAPAKP